LIFNLVLLVLFKVWCQAEGAVEKVEGCNKMLQIVLQLRFAWWVKKFSVFKAIEN
jgi:hypothetical protein